MTKLRVQPDDRNVFEGPCFYQTPAMRAQAPDYFLPGALELAPPGVRVKLPNGRYLTPCLNGDPTQDTDTDTPLDQETFAVVEGNPCVLVIDRTRFSDETHQGRAYLLAIAGLV